MIDKATPSPTIQALEFYSGIGGLHLALKRSNVNSTVVRAFDWDQTACNVYESNFGQNTVSKVDIATLTPQYLSGFNANLWLLSPACQPYTVLNPNAKGASDPRAQSFLRLITQVLPEMRIMGSHPQYILVENVAGFETSTTRTLLLSTLRSLNYAMQELLLTPLQFGVPNSRLRYYLLAKGQPLKFAYAPRDDKRVWRCIPGRCDRCANLKSPIDSQTFHESINITEIKLYLDHDCLNEARYYIPDKVLVKWGRLFDIVLPSSKRTCCFTRGYTQLVERSGSILQLNEELDTTTTFNKFLSAHGNGDDNAVRILDPLKLRYFTPTELLRLFDFEGSSCCERNERSFIWPDTVTTKAKYRLIGNSVNVRVVVELLNYLLG
ncbi:hypothetical protein AMATHDRAFT_192665 [Amanita thiersii Skay4041]|uniref:tRNA (cytosine(38)-C(5))-methyltransferase n=1 Tax=Amanita thiersii Skay4041 TaxID=703135 RepID=A0A2A9NR27_9AGAR|nr:hypothetical protein AMATHDRAFT_192665 [Amanita thiersii Skay4041]